MANSRLGAPELLSEGSGDVPGAHDYDGQDGHGTVPPLAQAGHQPAARAQLATGQGADLRLSESGHATGHCRRRSTVGRTVLRLDS